jgi:hypothetical protein
MLYTVYKTTNLINDKIYIGFHSIDSMDCILCTESIYDSIFLDGYLGSGKLIKRALEKYGPQNMKQELLLVTDDRDEAEELERELVNKEFVKDDTNYNLSLGGNVTILFEENNGFYGKKHNKLIIEKIQQSRNETLKNNPFSWCEIIDKETGDVFFNKSEVATKFQLCHLSNTELTFTINEMIFKGKLEYKSEYLQHNALKNYKKRKEFLDTSDERKRVFSETISKRFKGIPKTKESNEKRGKSISNWIKENPELHNERMNKINKNPDKIRKMTEKQIGKIWITNPSTNKNTRHDPSLPIPEGWNRGFKKT